MPVNEEDFLASWQPFIQELQENVVPLYLEHEREFDGIGMHGRMHICRAVMFAETMARYYQSQFEIDLNFYALRIATAFHDSGREDNDPDVWEAASAARCFQYLVAGSPDSAYYARNKKSTRTIARWIPDRSNQDIHARILHDADVLEIMRPCSKHGGYQGFRPKSLRFGGEQDPYLKSFAAPQDLRQALINEAWNWIQKTETLKQKLTGSTCYMQDLLEVLEGERTYYPILSMLIEG